MFKNSGFNQSFLVMLHNSNVNIMFLKFCVLRFYCIVTYVLQTIFLKLRFIFCNWQYDAIQQAFINYVSYTRFLARKTVLGARPCTWEIAPVKEQKCTLLITTWYGGRKCIKLVFKPLAAKSGLSISVLCTAPFL